MEYNIGTKMGHQLRTLKSMYKTERVYAVICYDKDTPRIVWTGSQPPTGVSDEGAQ